MNVPSDSGVATVSADALKLSEEPSPGAGGGSGRAALVAIVLIGAATAIHLTPLRSYLADAEQMRNRLLALGAWVYPTTILTVAALLVCGVPRLPIHAAGGLLFGFAIGLTLTVIGAILGHYMVFLFIRWGGREWLLRRWPTTRKWADVIHDHGSIGVLLVRQLPMHAMVTNLCLALSNVKHGHFLIGTALGILPEAIPATLIGAGLMRSSLKDSARYLTLGVAVFAIIWIGSGYTLAAFRKRSKEFA